MRIASQPRLKPNLLCIVPPYSTNGPPAGAAALLGYLKANGCRDFDFLDLRLGVPDVYAPTYAHTGLFAESFVMDIPDLPLVLEVLHCFDRGENFFGEISSNVGRYCMERGISANYLHTYLTGLDRYFAAVFEQMPCIDFIGFSVWTSNYLSTLMAATRLKRRKNPPFIVLGGPQVTESRASAMLGLRSGLVDAVAQGEGEHSLFSLYNGFSHVQRSVDVSVPGTLSRSSAAAGAPAETQPLIRLHTLPLPSFSEMHLQAYQQDEVLTLPFQISRGCTDRCSFCSEWVFWKHFRIDTVEHVIEQIKQLQYLYGASFISFTDSLLNGHPRRLGMLAEKFISESIEIEWSGFMRAQMDVDTARLLKRAGCHDVFIGIESFSDETLELMNKRRTEAENVSALRAFLEAGIGVTGGFIPGFPGDSRDSFIHSAVMLQKLQRSYPGLLSVNDEPFIVSPGQPLYSKLQQNGLTPKPWDGEYLEVAQGYGDITSRIWCTVEGESQGLERLGRLRIAAMVSSDSPDTANSFGYEKAELVTATEFQFDHLFGGWYLAQIKSSMAYVYAVLVNQSERDELEELQADSPSLSLTDRKIGRALRRIERSHILKPPATGPRVQRYAYERDCGESVRYTVSPFVLGRALGWRHGNQVLLADSVSGRVHRRSGVEGPLLTYLARGPRTIRQLSTFTRRRGVMNGPGRLVNTVRALKESGVVVMCAAGEQGSVLGGLGPAQFERVKVVAGPVIGAGHAAGSGAPP